jgi:hypothetical protein
VARLSRTGPQFSPRRAAGRGASDRRATLPEACGYRRGQVLSESVHTFDAAADQLESSIRSAQQSPRAQDCHGTKCKLRLTQDSYTGLDQGSCPSNPTVRLLPPTMYSIFNH